MGTAPGHLGPATPGRRAWGTVRRRWRTGPAWTGAAILLAVVVLVLWWWWAREQTITAAPGASWAILVSDLAVALAVGVVIGVGATVLALVVRRPLPVPFLIVFVASALVLVRAGPGPSLLGWLVLCVLILAGTPLLGGLLSSLIGARAGDHRMGPGRIASGGAAAGALGIVVALLAWTGTGAPDLVTEGTGEVSADPTRPGPHSVQTITYGSGASTDRYGTAADVRTEPVDASGIIEGWAPDSLRSGVWGFDATALPVNAIVWAPAEGGPHPLVLIVHGNAPHQDSELGFAYLGELLASRGFIVAALDQNFLNTTLLDRSNGIGGAEQARAWMVLKHLQQWEDWQDQDHSPLTAQADLDRVALIGHSRGGEAALVATALHQADADPGLPGSELAPGATIDTVITLAPSDQVAGDPVSLQDVHFLTVTGSHDDDVGSIPGQSQYTRTQISAGEIKAAVMIYRANHSHFNSVWGHYDAGFGLSKHLQNSAALLSPDEQRGATEAFVSAFLDRTLIGDDATGLFHGPLPQVSWLPRTDFRISRAVGDQAQIVDFTGLRELPEGVSIEGGRAEPTTFPPHATSQGNTVVHLLPDEEGQHVSLSLSPDDLTVEGHHRIVIDLAQAGAPAENTPAITVELDIADSTGAVATCPVTGPAGIPEQLPSRTVPWPLPATGPTSQPHLQSYAVDPGCTAHSDVDLGDVDTLIFRIAGLPAEGIYVDHVGVAELH